MKIDFLKIKAAMPIKHSHPGFDAFVASMEKLIREVIPESVIAMHETSQFIPVDASFEKLNQALPIIHLSEEEDAPCSLSITTIVREEHTQGVGLFLCDMISQKLFPGKAMPIIFLRSLSFKFIIKPKERFYAIEIFLGVETLKELFAIKKNFERFKEEVRLSILGVEKARKLVLAKGMTAQEKRMVLAENLETLIRSKETTSCAPLFADMHSVMLKTMYDLNPDKVPDHVLPYIDFKPKNFDHFIFKEMEKLSILFHEEFASIRPLAHLSKAISYLYLFRKILSYSARTAPNKRHLSLKLLPLKVNNVPTLAVLLGVNFIEPGEVLSQEDILNTLASIVPSSTLLLGSNVIDEQRKEGTKLVYLELQKTDKSPFQIAELRALKRLLSRKIKSKIYLPKDPSYVIDEEKMRGILLLSKELTTVHDRSEAIIQFHNESDGHYHFSVIVSRLQKPEEKEIELFSTPPITVRKQERKVAGILEKRYIKEIYLYDVSILTDQKSIKEARKDLFQFIKKEIPNLHDYSGGTVSRKYENLKAFKSILKTPLESSLIENYFYAITPPYMQSLTPPEVLKEHFEIILKALELNFAIEKTHILKEETEDHILIVIASSDEKDLEELRKKVHLGKDDIAAFSLKALNLHFFGLILPKEDKRKVEILDDLALLV